MTVSDLPLADPADFRATVQDRGVALYTLARPGLVTQITNFGGRIVNLFFRDRQGTPGNVVLGFGNLEAYLGSKERYYGAIIGRYANRISGGRFVLDDRPVQLETNNGPNHLHGGRRGFHKVVWSVDRVDDHSIALSYVSANLEEGYPGELTARVTYSLLDRRPGRREEAGRLRIVYEAETGAPTIVNMTNHAYFNLGGAGSGPVAGHLLQIDADRFTPIDETAIPTGEIAEVERTPFDFRMPTPIGSRLDADDDQLRLGKGYDHNFVLSGRADAGAAMPGPLPAARVTHPSSGRTLELTTTEPGLQFYGGNFFDGTDVGSSGRAHCYRECFALEPQHFPDSPNKPEFPSVVLRPGERYRSESVYTFSVASE